MIASRERGSEVPVVSWQRVLSSPGVSSLTHTPQRKSGRCPVVVFQQLLQKDLYAGGHRQLLAVHQSAGFIMAKYSRFPQIPILTILIQSKEAELPNPQQLIFHKPPVLLSEHSAGGKLRMHIRINPPKLRGPTPHLILIMQKDRPDLRMGKKKERRKEKKKHCSLDIYTVIS